MPNRWKEMEKKLLVSLTAVVPVFAVAALKRRPTTIQDVRRNLGFSQSRFELEA